MSTVWSNFGAGNFLIAATASATDSASAGRFCIPAFIRLLFATTGHVIYLVWSSGAAGASHVIVASAIGFEPRVNLWP